MLLGGSVIYMVTWGPMKKSKEKIEDVLTIQTDSISEIQIAPWNYEGNRKVSLLYRTFRIRDTGLIRRFNKALQQGKVTNEVLNTSPKWTCRVEIIKTNNETISFGVKRHKSTVLHVASRDKNGWIYGNIWADTLGNLIDSIVSH